MPKLALIEPGGRIAQFVALDGRFPVAAPLNFVEVPDDITLEHRIENGQIIAPPVRPPPPTPQQEQTERLDRDRLLQALMEELADRFGITKAQLVASIRARL